MDPRQRIRASKFLSLVLRHRPAAAGLTLDGQGWVAIDELLAGCAAAGRPLGREQVDEIVALDGKQRFAVSDDGLRIRASQGHSANVDLGYRPADPPDVLYHGTVATALSAIRAMGLSRMKRHHVHLSVDRATAAAVGGRRGRAVVLAVDGRAMVAAGHVFYRSDNGVWLTDAVPPEFLSGGDQV